LPFIISTDLAHKLL